MTCLQKEGYITPRKTHPAITLGSDPDPNCIHQLTGKQKQTQERTNKLQDMWGTQLNTTSSFFNK